MGKKKKNKVKNNYNKTEYNEGYLNVDYPIKVRNDVALRGLMNKFN